ncbi:MAG: tetratricopeptide repeat protein [Thiohalomonadales bacterium]
MLRIILNFKFTINIIFISVITLSNFNLILASDDWVHDLRYKEFITEADNGSGAAMYELGIMTERGHGTEKNIEKAIAWYIKAVENDYPSANVRLGKLYLEGVSVDKNYDLAFKYLQSAKKSNASGAYYYLAVMYENGYGTKQDLTRAKQHYDKAAKWGHYGAQEKSKKIAAILKEANNKPQVAIKVKEKSIVDLKHENKTKVKTSQKIVAVKKKKPFVTIKDIKKSLLSGMWFNGDSPLGFLPSPRTYCISKNKIGLRCVSKEMSRNTGREKVYYLIESKISDIDNYGDFTISYKNKVTKVDVYNSVTESGETYVTRIKVGEQKKTHILKCTVTGKNVNCNKNGMQNYQFVNLIRKSKKYSFQPAFE